MDVLCTETVFVAVLEEPFARVYHKDTVTVIGVLLVNHDNTGGDTGTVKEVGQVDR